MFKDNSINDQWKCQLFKIKKIYSICHYLNFLCSTVNCRKRSIVKYFVKKNEKPEAGKELLFHRHASSAWTRCWCNSPLCRRLCPCNQKVFLQKLETFKTILCSYLKFYQMAIMLSNCTCTKCITELMFKLKCKIIPFQLRDLIRSNISFFLPKQILNWTTHRRITAKTEKLWTRD